MAAEETISSTISKRRGQDKAAWTSIRARSVQVALLDVLRKRHLENTGKEVSRAEVLAALMSEGLERLLGNQSFGEYQK
ncbi:hypothetical protein NO357_14240 [Marimonas arenosa]|uniref:Uncharacterized protein n=1 Tax=Marimonas arenosa TaxID=1795305 RepID=A0AAE3WG48_9RHOB|nr:hypothetical protein [Marimonas arenosa]